LEDAGLAKNFNINKKFRLTDITKTMLFLFLIFTKIKMDMIIRQAAYAAEKLFPGTRFVISGANQSLFLTFDDGPHPETTPRILEMLAKHNAMATFFCLGRNAEKYPLVYHSILAEGHSVGNHSWSHPDGWFTRKDKYIADVERASAVIGSGLFRPPYGRITPAQYLQLRKKFIIVMWTRQFADYRPGFSAGKANTGKIHGGDILVMHDSPATFANTILLLEKILSQDNPFTLQGLIPA
jgi:peptidoglycan-N-acetylglucosamine deacetylase